MKLIRNFLSATLIASTLMSAFSCSANQDIDKQSQQVPQLFVGNDTYTYVGDGEPSANIFLFDDQFNVNGCIYSGTSYSVESGWTLIDITKRICSGDHLPPGAEGVTELEEHYKARAQVFKHKDNGKAVNELTRGDLVEKL